MLEFGGQIFGGTNMQKPLLSWIDEQAGINAFLTGEVDSLPLGNPIGVTTDSLRAQNKIVC
jgi:acyl-CoA hydrolase